MTETRSTVMAAAAQGYRVRASTSADGLVIDGPALKREVKTAIVRRVDRPPPRRRPLPRRLVHPHRLNRAESTQHSCLTGGPKPDFVAAGIYPKNPVKALPATPPATGAGHGALLAANALDDSVPRLSNPASKQRPTFLSERTWCDMATQLLVATVSERRRRHHGAHHTGDVKRITAASPEVTPLRATIWPSTGQRTTKSPSGRRWIPCRSIRGDRRAWPCRGRAWLCHQWSNWRSNA